MTLKDMNPWSHLYAGNIESKLREAGRWRRIVKHSPKITKGRKHGRNHTPTFRIPLNIGHAVIDYAVIVR
jgi:hypothetical protein